jgi:hypothetical protein
VVEDAAVRIAKEVLRVDQLGGVVERFVVDQDRTENRFLGFEVVRKGPLRRGDVRHGIVVKKKRARRSAPVEFSISMRISYD